MLRTQTGKTPLYCASISGHRAVVELLLDNDADTNISDEVMFLV